MTETKCTTAAPESATPVTAADLLRELRDIRALTESLFSALEGRVDALEAL
jgi:hypothetical protein